MLNISSAILVSTGFLDSIWFGMFGSDALFGSDVMFGSDETVGGVGSGLSFVVAVVVSTLRKCLEGGLRFFWPRTRS